MSAISEFRLRNQLPELRRLGDMVQTFAQSNQLPPPVVQALDLSLAEWVTNVISHAHQDAAEHWIDVRLSVANGAVRVEVRDDGLEFNPLLHPPADTTTPLEERNIGGLGILMMRKLMDSVEYRREGTRNVVTMTKGLGGSNR